MIIVSDQSYSVFEENEKEKFAYRCARFLMEKDLFPNVIFQDACKHVESRMAPIEKLALISERAITLAIAIELKSERMLESDQRLVNVLEKLPIDEAVRLERLKTYVDQSPEWQL